MAACATDGVMGVTDAALIVAAVNALPALLDIVEAAEELHGGGERYVARDVARTTMKLHDALARLKEIEP